MSLMTVKAYWRALKAEHPDCPIGLGTIRAAVRDGVIPSFPVGRSRVIESQGALDYLFAAQEHKAPKAGGVRKIDP